VAVQVQRSDGIPASVFDALPFPAMVVDEDMRLLQVNGAASRLFKAGTQALIRQRGGEALHCINSSDGCGRSTECPDCVLRGAARFAATVKQPARRRARLEVLDGGNVTEMHALITASPVLFEGATRVLVLVEDLTLLLATTDVLPICMGCKKVLDQNLWTQIEAYLDSHLDLKFSHGICPDCRERLYPDFPAADR
jgi:hypothetical protein